MRILLLYADATQTLPVARSLHKKCHTVDGVFASKWSYGYPSRFISKRYMFSDVENAEAYYEFVRNVLTQTKYDSIIPMNDDSAVMISKYRTELQALTAFVMPSFETFTKGYDKNLLMQLCSEKGYPHPKTVTISGGKIEDVPLGNLRFPLLIKPNYTSGGRGMTLVNNQEELLKIFPSIYNDFGDCHLQEYMPKGGSQVKIQLYVDGNGQLVQSSVIKKLRWYPENGGSSCCNVSWTDDKIVDTCYHILCDIGWTGFADFDTIEDPRTGELLIMEINPRLPACVKTCFASGIDWADIILCECFGLPHKKYTMQKEVYLRHLGFEMLWFFYSKNRWKTKPNWFKLIGRHIHYQDMSGWSDPLPFLFGTFGNIKKQLSSDFRKTKSGTR